MLLVLYVWLESIYLIVRRIIGMAWYLVLQWIWVPSVVIVNYTVISLTYEALFTTKSCLITVGGWWAFTASLWDHFILRFLCCLACCWRSLHSLCHVLRIVILFSFPLTWMILSIHMITLTWHSYVLLVNVHLLVGWVRWEHLFLLKPVMWLYLWIIVPLVYSTDILWATHRRICSMRVGLLR